MGKIYKGPSCVVREKREENTETQSELSYISHKDIIYT